MSKGYLALVLHAHLPYVRHPEHEDFLEEEWFYEAITETYIPLLDVFEGLVRDNVYFKITMSITPPLMNMFANKLLQDRYLNYIDKLVRLSEMEVKRTENDANFYHTACMYRDKFYRIRDLFLNKYKKNLLNGFRYFLEFGVLEIITCGATHGFFPFMSDYPSSIEATVSIHI